MNGEPAFEDLYRETLLHNVVVWLMRGESVHYFLTGFRWKQEKVSFVFPNDNSGNPPF